MTIIVCPLSLVPDQARAYGPSHVVSLLDPDTEFPSLSVAPDRHLRISVHDLEAEVEGFDVCCDVRMKSILSFVQSWDRKAPLLVHCYAGISRSTATAFIAACAVNPDADERAIARALREASPTASPNRRFVDLADVELGRNGRMSAAIERIGRGATWFDIGEAKPFALPSRFA